MQIKMEQHWNQREQFPAQRTKCYLPNLQEGPNG